MGAEAIYITYTMQLPNYFFLLFPIGLFAVVFFYFRKVKVISYDDNSLYVGRFSGSEQISMREVSSVNIPDSLGDSIFEIELKSGRKIEFIPTFKPPTWLWQKQEPPGNVRQFQAILREFEMKQAS